MSHPQYLVTYEDGFTEHQEVMTIDLYRDLVMGYPVSRVETSYWNAYGGMEGYERASDLWRGENFARFTEQDYADGPDAWLMPIAEDHNMVAWETVPSK